MNFYPRLLIISLVFVFAAPVVALLGEAVSALDAETSQVSASDLVRTGTQSLLLVLGSVLGASAFALCTAYLCARYNFTGRKILLWGSILPLSIPSYLTAYTWIDFLIDQGIPGGQLRNSPMACLIFALSLSPYIFLPTFTALSQMPCSLIENARLLGTGGARLFWRLELPLIRSSLLAGLLLAGLEILADFGTVDFMAVDTWTTAIYRYWFGRNDRQTASLLAIGLFLFCAFILFLESQNRHKKSVAASGRGASTVQRSQLPWLTMSPVLLAAACPALFGFLLPLIILIFRVTQSNASEFWISVMTPAGTTLVLASIASLVVVLFALPLVWILRAEKNRAIQFFARVSSLGYAIPGGVLGLGLLILLAPFSLTGSFFGLIYGYCVRFATIGTSSIEARWHSIPHIYESQARLLGCSSTGVFLRITLPLLRRSILCAFILTMIDVIKELPATMMLRPFNVETLAIRTYNLASDERLAETAPTALAMVLLCIAGLCAAQKLGAFSLAEDLRDAKDATTQKYLH